MSQNTRRKWMAAGIAAILVIGSLVAFQITGEGKAVEDNPIAAEKSDDNIAVEEIKSPEHYEEIFEKDKILDIYVEVSEEDWKSILDNPTAEEYKSAKVTIGDTTFYNVGFRTKGNSSLSSVARSDSERYSFRIKLDKYDKGQNFLGLDEFVVNNMFSDPSYMREYLTYEALREIGADVPLTAFSNVYINGELYGFYLCIEAIDDSFLERNFGDAEGNLYKQEQGSTLVYVEGSSYDKSEFKSGNDDTKADLKNFIQILHEMPEGEKGTIETVLDVDSALRYIAANTVLGSYDSYNGNFAHNFYLYSQENRFTVIPWDYNMSMAGFGGGGAGRGFGSGDVTTIPIDEPVSGTSMESRPLIDNLLKVEEYKEKYYGYVKELIQYLENFEPRVEEIAAIIRPYIEADPTKFYTMEQFEANISYSEITVTEAAAMDPGQMNNPPANMSPQTNSGLPEGMGEGQPNARMQRGGANGNRQNIPQGVTEGFGQDSRPEVPKGFEMGDWSEMRERFGEGNLPEGFEEGNWPEMPQGAMGREMRGGAGGGMIGNMPTSIMNFVKDRVENIKQQLNGQLPTTASTTETNKQ